MAEKPHAAQLKREFTADIEENIGMLEAALNMPENEDVIFRRFESNNLKICIVYVEGLADEKKIGDFVLRSLRAGKNSYKSVTDGDPLGFFQIHMLEMPQAKRISICGQAVQQVIAGMTCLLVDGSDEALMMETRSYPNRGVGIPTNEAVVNGSHEGFNENLRTNISLIRRYVQSPELLSEKISVGTGVPTMVSMVYLKGVASESSIAEVRKRLKCIKCSAVMGIGAIQQLIEDHPFALLPQMLQTERPDRVASCIEDGQIAILAENSPYALVVPVTIFHLIHSSDDSFLRWQYGSALRIVRLLGLLISLILPSLYIALTLYHSHLIPMPLLTSIAESRANVPFPIVAEVLFMEFSFYLINEAGLRTPAQIGSAFGIVGALIIGQTAVSASIISPILIIIIALTGLGNYVVPNYSFGIGVILYRLMLIALSALLGLYGLMIGLFMIFAHLCSMKSFGVYYMAPIAPRRRHNPDILLRLPVWLQKHAGFFSRQNNWMEREDAQ